MTWIRAGQIVGMGAEPRLVRHGPLQIAVFAEGGKAFAIDNRCPHEGYPLAQGSVSEDCILTCNWHNWKFRLEDGQCLLGGDDVRAYPTQFRNGDLWIDVSPLPPDTIRPRVIGGLRKAFDDRDFGRIARELARLHYNGIDASEGVRTAVEWAHDRLEFGSTHALAATTDWLALSSRFVGDFEKQLICLAEAVDYLAHDSLRQPVFAYPDAGPTFAADAWLDAVEREDREDAEAGVRQALRDGKHWRDLEGTLAEAALAHYNDFGHSLIYVAKTGQLIAALGPEIEPWVLLPLTRALCYAYREDRLPEFRQYRSALDRVATADGSGSSGRPPVPFESNTAGAFEWLAEYSRIHPPHVLYDALLEALAHNMLHFDTSYGTAWDRPVGQNVSWLDFTHGITFANAARVLCTRHPRLWPRALTQMACFLGRNRGFILESGAPETQRWRVDDAGTFFQGIRENLLDHGLRDPIFPAHLLKTNMAVEAELGFATGSCRETLLASLNRFLSSPLKTKHVRRLARQAIALVARDVGD